MNWQQTPTGISYKSGGNKNMNKFANRYKRQVSEKTDKWGKHYDELYKIGVGAHKIAVLFKVPVSKLYEYIYTKGLCGKRGLKSKKEKAILLYKYGLSGIQISMVLNTKERNVYRWLSKQHIKANYRGLKTVEKSKPKRKSRGKEWGKVRLKIIKKYKGKCSVCYKNGNQVHHIEPACKAPELYLEESNLTLLCLKCHCFQHPNNRLLKKLLEES